nr:HAD-IIIC family phosphatase [Saccharofermentans sp.]
MKVALLSNVNVDIVKQCLEESSDVVYVPYGYNTWYQDILSDESDLFKFYPDLYVLLIEGNALIENSSGPEDRRTIVESEIEKIREVVQRIRGLVLIANLDIHSHHIVPLSVIPDDYALEGLWLEGLSEISQRYQNVCILDIKKIVCMMGTDSFYDPRVWYLGSIPYSLRAIKAIAKEIGAIERAYQGKRKKCLAVDLDNTIWGGVVGEDGINGIVLGPVKEGARFMNIQKRLKELKNTGVVLAVVSKNNPEEALNAIRNHPNMILHEDDFVEILANWKPKSENIRQLSADLNIGVDAIVLLDDNPVEREEVRANLPNVMVIEPRYAKEIFDEDIVNSFAEYFLVLKLTNEDKVKTEQYRGEFRRKEVLSSSRTLEEYLERLEIHVHLRKAKNQDIDRIAQLTQKTNQFNLTSKRY